MARLDDRGGRDAAGQGPYHRPEAELTPLREMGNLTLTDGEPDIRGWEVQTVGGRAIGKVRDLLVDRAAGEVVMLDLDLDGSAGRGRAPIRAVQIDRSARVVRMDSADLATVGSASADARADMDIPRSDGVLADRAPAGASPTPRAGLIGDARETGETRREVLADGTVEETVVERRPVVYEEVVVRRRTVDPGDADEVRGER